MKRFYRCSKAEFKEMTLHEVFQLLEDATKLAKAESGEKPSKTATRTSDHEELKRLARKHKIKVPTKGF